MQNEVVEAAIMSRRQIGSRPAPSDAILPWNLFLACARGPLQPSLATQVLGRVGFVQGDVRAARPKQEAPPKRTTHSVMRPASLSGTCT
jgi:hypothetical protein